MKQWIQQQAETNELRDGTGRVTAPARVCVSFPNGTSLIGDPVRVTVTASYQWIPFIGAANFNISGSSTMRLEQLPTYTAGCYATAALALLVAAVVAGQPLGGYAARQWLGLVALTATAQLLGHSVFNHLLATVSAAVVSLALLLEIPGAALIAAAWLGQVPSPAAFAGLVLILVGMAVVVRSMPGPELPATAPA